MNKHIEIVKKWLDDPDSVTEKELRVNSDAAAAHAAHAADDAAAYAADAAAYAHDAAAAYAHAAADADDADFYVMKYEELTG